ncbi:MAG TPA: BatA and WFA domain-containing protein [Chthonomonadaceae bacterium]|nr:BatA and WFA domain-containing protein [Chthonomonadaceae bacterium]
MTFLTPAFLGALALVGIPLLIHLIRRRKLKVVQWAAMEFLRQSQRRQRRRLRIEELILLLLRILIIACAVLAFARPVLRAMGVPLLSQNTHVYAVIVLDNSFSMDARGSDGKTSFDRAKAAAVEVVTRVLRDGDSVSLVLLSDNPEATVDAPSFDRGLVRRRIEAAHVGDRGTDNLAGARMVDRLLRVSKTPVREVYWISDDQSDAWATSRKESARATWSEMGKLARVNWISAGSGENERDNLQVESPILGSELVTPQLATRIDARIVNHGIKPRNDLLVNLIVDGAPKASTRVSVPPGGSATAEFIHQFVRTGTHTGSISLNDPANVDMLEHDNSAPFVVRVRDRVKVLVLDPRPARNPSQSESYFLVKAMAPDESLESLQPRLREGESLSGVTLRDYDVVAIAGMADGLSQNDRAALAEYVKAGGGVVLFPGPDTDARQVNAALGGAGLLPARLGARKKLDEKSGLKLDPSSIRHPALSLFKDTTNLHLSGAQFFTYYALDPANDEASLGAVRVMIRYNNGDPALVERQVGLGHVVLAASTAGRLWNDLPLQSSYVPLVYQLMFYLGQGATSHRNLKLDEPLFLSLPLKDANKAVRVTAPDSVTSSQSSTLDSRGVTFRYDGTSRAGIYRVAVAGSGTSDAFAVGLPGDESNLAYTDPRRAVAEAGVPTNDLAVAQSPEQIRAMVSRARYGAEIWYSMICAVLGMLFLESLLAQKFGRRG